MGIVANFKRNRAVKRYLKKLPKFLSQDYGRSKIYTPIQIDNTIDRYDLSPFYTHYGIALFSDKAMFEEHYLEAGNVDDVGSFDDIRFEVADKYFQGNTNFTFSDIDSVFDDASAAGDGSSDSGDSGGGDGGGD